MRQEPPSAQDDADRAAPLSVRISAWLAANLTPLNSAIRQHPWVASTVVAVCAAVIGLLGRGPVEAVEAFVGVFIGCRLLLWALKKTGGFVPPPPFSQ
jgi:hypothetical protein